ncbi:MAG: hypothetical protein J7605_02140 [Variovorax sp.]|nr:hypothetical protein [Variovorax sp.]
MQQPVVVVLDTWPQPHSVSDVLAFGTGSELAVRYVVSGGHEVALVHFPLMSTFRLGSPNDEALGGHPLAKFGLKYYSVHRVENSPWIADMERQNSVHPRHDKTRFLASKTHYIFTFQDSMLECVASEGGDWTPRVRTFDNAQAAQDEWRRLIGQLTGDKEDF